MNNQQAINLLKNLEQSLDDYCELNNEGKTAFGMAIAALELFGNAEQLPSAQQEQHYDEWCTDCKEYDKERHCCPRWNRVIRQTLKDAQPELRRGEDGFQRECIEQAQLNRIDMVKDTETCHLSTPTKIVAQINFDNAKLKEIVDEAVKRLKKEMKWEVD